MYWAGSAARLYSFLAPSGKDGFSDLGNIVDKYVSDEALRKGRERSGIIDKVGEICLSQAAAPADLSKYDIHLLITAG